MTIRLLLAIGLCVIPIVKLVAKVDARLLLGIGFAVIALSNVMQSYEMTLETGFWTMAVALALSGLGSGMSFIPLTIAVLRGTTKSEGPKGTAFINLSLQFGGSISVAVLDVLLHQGQEFHSSVLAANATLANPVVQQYLAHGSVLDLSQQLYPQSSILSYADVTMAIGAVAALCAPAVSLLRKRQGAHDGPIDVELAA